LRERSAFSRKDIRSDEDNLSFLLPESEGAGENSRVPDLDSNPRAIPVKSRPAPKVSQLFEPPSMRRSSGSPQKPCSQCPKILIFLS
jgi:hypothetical protein